MVMVMAAAAAATIVVAVAAVVVAVCSCFLMHATPSQSHRIIGCIAVARPSCMQTT